MHFADGSFFHRAILQSGSALSSWAIALDPIGCTHKLAQNVNCSANLENTTALKRCLNNKTFEELVNNSPVAPKYYSCFAPTVDGQTVIKDNVEKLLTKPGTMFTKADLLIGITKNEAYSYLKQDEIVNGLSATRKTQIIRTYVHNVFRYHRQKIYEILDHHYTDWNRAVDTKSRRDSIMDLLSDGQYVAPLLKVGQYHTNFGNTYLYSFSYSTQAENYPGWSSGVHGDELAYVFGAPLVDGISPFPASYTKSECMLSEAVMRYWSNFAYSG